MGNNVYAPVLIATLNRYEHFKRCLESLERCTWAEHTDVYVALDYPPSEKYVAGWKKIDAFLQEKEKRNGFKSLIVIRRKENYGVGHNKSNMAELCQEVRQAHASYITTEDDNEFAPNFLVYMNKALNRFENDEKVCCVCGYNRRIKVPETFNANCYLANDYVAWGVGYWSEKRMPVKYRSLETYKGFLRDKNTFKELKKQSPDSLRNIVTMLKINKLHGDVQINVYEALEGKYSLMPVISKVRNHGNDGTGLHSKSMVSEFDEYFSAQEIDQSAVFGFPEVVPMQPEGLQVISPAPLLPAWKKAVKYLIFRFDLFLIRHFGIVPHSKYI